jgi:hypothetical protein
MRSCSAAETLTTIAADPKHLGAQIGVTAVLHTWGQTRRSRKGSSTSWATVCCRDT